MKNKYVIAFTLLAILGAVFIAFQSLKPAPIEPLKDSSPVISEIEKTTTNKIISQQQRSREGIRRLAEGQVEELTLVGTPSGDDQTKRSTVQAKFVDGSVLTYTMIFTSYKNGWVISGLNRDKLIPSSHGIPSISEDEYSLGQQMLTHQLRLDHQDIYTEWLDGKISSIIFGDLNASENSVNINITVTYRDGHDEMGIVELQQLNGQWYVMGCIPA